MRVSQVLQRSLDSALSPMHALSRQPLLLAVESLLAGAPLGLDRPKAQKGTEVTSELVVQARAALSDSRFASLPSG